MKRFLEILGCGVCFMLACLSCTSAATEEEVYQKPRTIVTCDPELDDNNSMIRFLLHATDFQIDGLIYTSSRFHWKNDGSGKTQFIELSEYDQLGLGPQTSWRFADDERFIDDIIDAYEKCYDNLKVHDADYPTPAYLRSVTKWGNCAFEGDYSYDTEGSELIKKNILDEKPGPLFLQAWGGSSTIAAALRSIADEYKSKPEWNDILKKVNEKVILNLSGDQDNAYNLYIAKEWPDIYVQNLGWNTMGRWDQSEYAYLTSPEWTAQNMTVGPIGALVRTWGDGKQMVKDDVMDPIGPSGTMTEEELRAAGYVLWTRIQPKGTLYGDGDSGCFYQLIDNGLRAWQDPTYGGWSGRWDVKNGKPESGHPTYMLNDLRPLIKGEVKEFNLSSYRAMMGEMKEDHTFPNMNPERNLSEAARMKWSVTPNYANANHYPKVTGPQSLTAKAGETITISARATDPDGNELKLHWWYFPVGTYVLTNDQPLAVSNPSQAETLFTVPADAKPGETIHFVLQAVDNGEPSLTRYLRTIITVTE